MQKQKPLKLCLFIIQGCATKDGADANKACVFPFQYNGTAYGSCTTKDHDQLWCATEVDANGDYIEGKWGNCNSYCNKFNCFGSGIITSPGFPGEYDNNLDLTWLIQVQLGQTIEINFLSFDVESHSSCV